ncbi:molybdopterin-guanine dinucleotide biosynthesis protein [Micrococcaceae bacterium RIT802]|nr:molybdopterin-guanine dinucleotide biosynthesis protein [Micrococcaceae bacterium RIT 802]
MSEIPELDAWVAELLEGLEIPDAPVDVDSILGMAGVAAHSIIRPAAPVTTYIAGYAAGLAAGAGMAGEAASMEGARTRVNELLGRRGSDQ